MPKIGSRDYPSIMLAPLAGCADLAFRLIAREHGARFCFFEMVDANSLTRGAKSKSLSLLKTVPEDAPIAAQLIGRGADNMLNAARILLSHSPQISFLDINAACPVKKVVRRKVGAFLLRDEEELSAIIKRLASELPVPVTVKIRIGFDSRDARAIAKIAKRCEKSGAAAIFAHARTREEGYSGDIDLESLKAVKDAVSIPVFGSGNIFSPQDAGKMIEETSCDGVMVARGALGNPWIFRDTEEYLSDSRAPLKVPCLPDRKAVLKRHLTYIERYKDCRASGKIGGMLKTFLWYTKGLPNAKRLRAKVSLVKSYDKMIELVESL